MFSRVLLGDRDRLGWWTLPAFLVIGLAGAVLAGSFVVVWQTQKIQNLENDIADARAELADAVERVRDAGDEALAAIATQVEDVQATVNAGLPVQDAAAIGVALLRVDVPGSAASPEPSPSPSGSDGAFAPPGNSGSSGSQARQPQARIGSAVAVAVDGATTFFATSYALVADPDQPGGVLETLSIDTGSGRVRAVVHSWDEGRDLALVRAEAGQVSLATWRAESDPIAAGDRAFVVGLTSTGDTLQQAGVVSFTDVATLLTDHDVVGTLRGGAIVDGDGRLVGIGSSAYQPFADDDRTSNVPIRLLCESLLRSCQAGESSDGGDTTDGGDADAADAAG